MIFSKNFLQVHERYLVYYQLKMRAKQILLLALLIVTTFGQGGSISISVLDLNKPPCKKNAPDCGDAKTFKNSQEYESFIAKNLKQQVIQLPSQPQPRPPPPPKEKGWLMGFSDQMGVGAASVLQVGAGAPDHSETTKQVDTVDEADLIKNDGNYIYTISNRILSIIRAYPVDNAQVLSAVNLKEMNATALFLQGDYLAVFGAPSDSTSSNSSTTILIYDVTNRALPTLVRAMRASGRYFDGRKLTNGFMYLITTYKLTTRRQVWYDFGLGKKTVGYDSMYWYPQHTYGTVPLAINVISFNLRDPLTGTKNIATIFTESEIVMYMNNRYIYMASNITDYNGQKSTRISKVFVYGSEIQPFADAAVEGTVRNQFSLDEYSTSLRIATTTRTLAGTYSINVFVLDSKLGVTGKLLGFIRNQVVTSCRFIKTRLYLGTQVNGQNPFYTIRFGYKNPTFLGVLKVPGVFTYLHPYDQTFIIALGRQTNQRGQKQGLKISILDVSDAGSATMTANFEIEEAYANSLAEWQHKAFLFTPDKNLLVIPGRFNYRDNKFNGAFAFYVSYSEISLSRIIDHLKETDSDNEYNLRNLERSLWVQNFLYTKSLCRLKINDIESQFNEVNDLEIPCEQSWFDKKK